MGGESSESGSGQGSGAPKDQAGSQRTPGSQEGEGEQEQPAQDPSQSQAGQPQPQEGAGSEPGGGATDVYRPHFRQYFDPNRTAPEADGARWGFLPEEQRQDLQREQDQPFHPQYRAEIARYYRVVEELARRDAERREAPGATDR